MMLHPNHQLEPLANPARFNVTDAKKLPALEDENNRLKRILAYEILDYAALNDLARKNY